MKYVSIYGAYMGADQTVNNLPSETVPEQAFSVKDLLDRAARGIAPPCFAPVYDGEEDDETETVGFDDLDPLNRMGVGFDEAHAMMQEQQRVADEHKQKAANIKAQIEAQKNAPKDTPPQGN